MNFYIVILVIFALTAILNTFFMLYYIRKMILELAQIMDNVPPAPKKERKYSHTSLADKQKKEMDKQRRE